MSKELIVGWMVFAVVILVGGISRAEKSPEITSQIELANQLTKVERYEEARKLYKEILKSDASEVNIKAHRGYQNVMRSLGQQDEVRKEYQAKLTKEPKHAMWHYLYGRLLEGEALETEFREAIKLDPRFFWAYHGLGNFYKDNKKWLEAIKEFQEAIRIKPDSADAVHNLALMYYYSGELETAKTTWQQAQKLAPHQSEIALGLGICYKAQGKYDETINILESILDTDPDYWKAYEPLIQCYHAKEDYKRGTELRDKFQVLYKKTKDKELLKQKEIVIDIIRMDEGLLIVSEELRKTKVGARFILFELYYKGTISEKPDKVFWSPYGIKSVGAPDESYPEALEKAKRILSKAKEKK